MAKVELGLKRVCVSCGARFYDLARSPAACPKCGAEQPAEQVRRRSGNVVDLRKPKKVALAREAGADEGGTDEAGTDEAGADADIETEGEEEAEEGVLEDTADLDDDDEAIGADVEVDSDGDEPER